MVTRAFEDSGKQSSSRSGIRRAVAKVRELGTTRHEAPSACRTEGYVPRYRSRSASEMLSPSLIGCYADPIEVALEEHTTAIPAVIPDPGTVETYHRYDNPRDPGAWPKHVKVVTRCSRGRLRTFVFQPGESLGVFGKI